MKNPHIPSLICGFLCQQALSLPNLTLNSIDPSENPIETTCTNVLHRGRWIRNTGKMHYIRRRMVQEWEKDHPDENLEDQDTHPLAELNKLNTTKGVTMSGNSDIRWSGPDTCNYRIYHPNEIKRCLKRHYNKIQFVGDSRARQYFSALKPLITENNETRKYVMFDSSWQLPQENVMNKSGIYMDQAWVRKSIQINKVWRHRYGNGESEPDLLVITAMILLGFGVGIIEIGNVIQVDKSRSIDKDQKT